MQRRRGAEGGEWGGLLAGLEVIPPKPPETVNLNKNPVLIANRALTLPTSKPARKRHCAPAGGSDGNGKGRSGKRRPIRTTSNSANQEVELWRDVENIRVMKQLFIATTYIRIHRQQYGDFKIDSRSARPCRNRRRR